MTTEDEEPTLPEACPGISVEEAADQAPFDRRELALLRELEVMVRAALEPLGEPSPTILTQVARLQKAIDGVRRAIKALDNAERAAPISARRWPAAVWDRTRNGRHGNG